MDSCSELILLRFKMCVEVLSEKCPGLSLSRRRNLCANFLGFKSYKSFMTYLDFKIFGIDTFHGLLDDLLYYVNHYEKEV